MSKEHPGLPVAGYQPQSDAKVSAVNANKDLEERALRQIEALLASDIDVDPRMAALARTKLQEGFMWLNRAIFQPGRVKLPEDT